MNTYTFACLAPVIMLVVFCNTAFAQGKPKTNTPNYSQQVQTLTKLKVVQDAFAIIDKLEPTTRKEHIELTEVPAPPFQESVRANYFKKMLEAAGADKVWIDSIGNVLALRKGKKGTRTVVLDAHLDTVFPDGTDVNVKIKGDTLFAPGIADDTRGLIAILTVLKTLEQANVETTDDVLFVGTVGEEGLGDLRGVKYIVDKSKLKLDSWIAVDGIDISEIVNGGLGSVRYKATVLGPGGHSWGAFGLGNPHHAMAKAVNYFSDEATLFTGEVREDTNLGKTSFNIGRTGGGTSVNSIPFESWVEVDMRSESPAQLNKIDSIFKVSMTRGVADYNKLIKTGPKLTVQLDRIGYRPSGTTAETQPLVQRALAAAGYFTTNLKLISQSTNANTAIARGIPAITIGAGGKGAHEHSLEEWWINEKGADGIKFILLTLLLEAGVAGK
jgi:tripeptide aminopeptidase